MYKFTNGIVVFDKKTRDRYVKAGYKLVPTDEIVENKPQEVEDENTSDSRAIEAKPRKSKKTSK